MLVVTCGAVESVFGCGCGEMKRETNPVKEKFLP